MGYDWNLPTFLDTEAAEEGEEGGLSGEAGLPQHCWNLWRPGCWSKSKKDWKFHPISWDFSVFFFFFYLYFFLGMFCCFFGLQQTVSHLMFCFFRFLYLPGTQMTPLLIGKGLLLEGWNPKIADKQVPGICIYIYTDRKYIHIYII